MSRPRIGDVVHYQSYGTPGGEYGSLCRAALVTEVPVNPAEDGMVSLVVFDPTAPYLNVGVRHDQERSSGTWHYRCPDYSDVGCGDPDCGPDDDEHGEG